MSFVDDWAQITLPERIWLTDGCLNPSCNHARFRHGTVHRSRNHGGTLVSFDEDRCETCKCSVFRDSAPITVDDVLAAHRLLKLDPLSLADFGIGPEPREEK